MAELNSNPVLVPIRGEPWHGVRYGCTTRHGGISAGQWGTFNLGLHTGDDPRAVLENRRRLASCLPGAPFWLEQVHGTDVVDETGRRITPATTAMHTGPRQQGRTDVALESGIMAPPQADAAVTTAPGRVLAIMTADCAPVVIADVQGRALGVAHAGWRGLAAGVLECAFAALKARLPSATAWRAWVGPCIGQARFEVGDEVRHAFVKNEPGASAYFAPGRAAGKWQADLALLTRHRLETMGIYTVELSGLCTHERADLFYSYRRAAVTGRMATVAWLEPTV